MNKPAENLRYTEPPISDFRKAANDKHVTNDIDVVMDEVLRAGTDESHCFLNEGRLKSNLALFQDNFLPDDPDRRIIYAMKANPQKRIMEILMDGGIDGFDCASANEITHAMNVTPIKPEGIYFNNPVKRDSDIHKAYVMGVSYYTAQSRSGVEKVLSPSHMFHCRDLEVAARLETQNPDATIDLSVKYGCSPEEGLRLLKRIREAGARAGLAMNTGSQNSNPHSYVEGIRLMAEVAEKHGGVSSVNLGGGFPVNYDEGDRFDVKDYLTTVSDTVRQSRARLFAQTDVQHRIIVEPGRALVANAVDLAIPVLEIDENRRLGKRRVFMNDGIFTSFSDKAIHDWPYHFKVYPKDGRQVFEHMSACTLYGRTCDSGDTLGEVWLPSDLREGDFLWVRNAGAYMDSQSTQFNGFGGPRYVSYNCR